MVLAKNQPFSYMYFFGKSSQKSSLFDILERKEYVLDRNSKFWKKSKKSKILKGLVHGFCQKSTFFLCVFFGEI